MDKLWNVSSSPHVRSKLNTTGVMYDVILALMPATFIGVFNFGFHALFVILASVIAAVLTEYIFDLICKRGNTIKDGSAVLTGLLLALTLPSSVPIFIPVIGAVFAILFVKCLFGGLGHNFMNPALGGRCFLLISFSSIVTNFAVDGVSMATPLADYAAGNSVNLVSTWLGFSNGVIGGSALGLILGGIYLLIIGGITIEIPASMLISFTAFVVIFGGHGFDLTYISLNLAAGGILMGAIFMATDPVTSPVTSAGQLLFGLLAGILCGVFRVYGSAADSVSYGIIIANLAVPLIDEITVPKPYGLKKPKEKTQSTGKSSVIPRSAVILCVITLIAGIALSSVYGLTKDTIDEQQLAKNAASYQEVCPDAVEFTYDESISAAVDALEGEIYGEDFGKAYINEVIVGEDASGNVVGYVISASSSDGYEGTITLSVGIDMEGTVNGIAFTELNETAGMGALCGEDAFKSQFSGVNTDKFILNKNGGSVEDYEIDSVSGASTSSGAVVNAVNAALDFYAANIK